MPISYGSHAAIFISNDDVPMLYDPAGSYRSGLRGSGDIFYGNEANLNDFISYHMEMSKITLILFPTTSTEEKLIAANMENIGGVMGGLCAQSVSDALKGIGPFKELGTYLLPGALKEALLEIRRGM